MEEELNFKSFKKTNIFKDKICLDKGYNLTKISEILHRKKEIETYMRHLSIATQNHVPGNLFVYGKMGIGKTMITKVLTAGLEKEAALDGINIKTVYIHCKTAPTNINVLKCVNDSLSLEINSITKTVNSFNEYFSKFCRLAKEFDGIIIIILDEMDKLKDPEILNILSRVKESGYLQKNVCIIGITNDIKFDTKLDAKTRSVLSESTIIFPPYDANQLRDILNQRAGLAFISGVLEEDVVPLCAAYAAHEHGDARRALELLKISGEIAEERGEVKVLEKHVKAALKRVEADKVSELIYTLPRQSKLVLASCIMCESTEQKTYTGEIYNQYIKCCKRVGVESLSQNRVVSSLSELNDIGLINAVTISKGRYGRMKEISLSIQAKQAWVALMEDENLIGLEEVQFSTGRQLPISTKNRPLTAFSDI